ncbi:MAG: hypothetical protein HY958_05965 [Bacteroidia bacterium]|nr:hypothetical protein [Bacteroidia bacterium]
MKILTGFVLLLVFLSSSYAQPTITTNAPTQTSLCAGGNVVIQYTTTGTFNFGCSFIAQLSDNWGNFTSPVDIGSMPFNTGIIMGTIPSSTPFGFNYRVRVVSTDPVVIGSTSPLPPIVITSTAITATITANPPGPVCNGDSVTLWATPNQSYFWSTGDTTQTIYVTESGSYNVTVTNYITGCEVSSTPVDVIVNPLPVVHLGNDTTLCEGQLLMLDAGPGFINYDWNNGQESTEQVWADTTGTWFVQVIDHNGCRSGDTINIIVYPNPVVNLGPDTSICGSSVLLAADPGYVSYSWNSGLSLNPSLLVTQTGLYDVLVTDVHHCKGRDSVFVEINQLPVVELGSDISICGNSVILNAGTGFTTYNWNNGQGANHNFFATETGTYSVVVTDNNGCTGFDSVSVTLFSLPYIDLGPDNDTSLCNGHSVLLDAGPGFLYYNWNNGLATTEQVTTDTAGTWFVQVTDANGCMSGDTIKVRMYPNPVINLGTDTSICGSIILSASGYVSYNWNNGLSLNPALLVTQTGFYDILVTDAHHCKGRDTIFVEINPGPVVELGSDISICGNSVILNAGTGYASYDWNNGQGIHHNYTATETGTYSVVVTDTNGCTGFDSVRVTLFPLPDVDLGPDMVIDSGSVVTLTVESGYAAYLWNNGSSSASVLFNSTDSVPGVYVYTVYVTDTNGCFNSDEIKITVLSKSFVEELTMPVVKIFPVPFTDRFMVTGLRQQGGYSLLMTDVSGRVIPCLYKQTDQGFTVIPEKMIPGTYILYLVRKGTMAFLSKVIAH